MAFQSVIRFVHPLVLVQLLVIITITSNWQLPSGVCAGCKWLLNEYSCPNQSVGSAFPLGNFLHQVYIWYRAYAKCLMCRYMDLWLPTKFRICRCLPPANALTMKNALFYGGCLTKMDCLLKRAPQSVGQIKSTDFGKNSHVFDANSSNEAV